MNTPKGNDILEIYKKQKNMNLSNYDKIKNDVLASRFLGLSLEQYVEARSLFCKAQHEKTCQDCRLQLNVAKYIMQEGY